MADEPVTTQQPPAGASPPATTTTQAPPATTQAAPPPVTTAPTTQQAAPPAPPPLVGDDGEIPEGADVIQMSKKALASRNDRAAKKYLRDHFGTDDPEAVKAKIKAAEQYEKAQEEQRRAAMTREQQLEEDSKKWRAKADSWKNRYESEVKQQAIKTSDTLVRSIGAKHLKEKFLGGDVYRQLGAHLVGTYSRRELEQLESEGKIQGVIDAWFGKYAEANPELTPNYGTPPPQAPLRAPLNNGANVTERPVPPTGTQQPKSFSPSSQNPMSPQEAQAEMARMGLRYD